MVVNLQAFPGVGGYRAPQAHGFSAPYVKVMHLRKPKNMGFHNRLLVHMYVLACA